MERSDGAGRGAWLTANATVFLSSFCVMVVELVAGRIVSRHLGASLYTWTSVIGVILAGLALGNWIGGRLADRFRAKPTLSVLFVASSATCVVIVVANNVVGDLDLLWGLAWPARVAAHVALVFFLPAALLGTISPVVAKRALGLGRATGRTLGSVYAWGVVGSIAGTFSTGYLLVSLMGTEAIIWSVASVLAVCGILYAPLSIRAWSWAGVVLAGIVLSGTSWGWSTGLGQRLALRQADDPSVVYRDESRYSHIEVRLISEQPEVRGLYLDKLLHSQISMDDPGRLHYGYVQIFSALTRQRAGGRAGLRTLTIGGGGYVFPRYLEMNWPQSVIDVVEIDPAVTRAARLAFGLPDDSGIRIHHMDGRAFINGLAERRHRGDAIEPYDFIYLDAVNDFSVPFQLTTVEFFEKIRSLLAEEGTLLVNFIELADRGRLAGALASTLEEVFPEVELFSLSEPGRLGEGSRVTLVLAASGGKFALAPPETARVDTSTVERYKAAAGGLVLRDSYAPVEQLVAPVVRAGAAEVGAADALARALRREAAGDQEGYLKLSLKALHIDPRFVEAHYNAGLALYRQGRSTEGMDHWRRALELDPAHAETHFNLGAALFREGRLDQALGHFMTASRLRPEMEQARQAVDVVLQSRARAGISGGSPPPAAPGTSGMSEPALPSAESSSASRER